MLIFKSLVYLTLFSSIAMATDRPDYELLRFNENWKSYNLSKLNDYDYFDPIKYISLSDEYDVWFSIGGQVRYRGEHWEGFNFNLPANNRHDDNFSLFRAFIHTDVHFGKNFRLFVMGKTALAEGRNLAGGSRTSDVDILALQNAFIDFIFPLSDNSTFTIRAGRQQLLFGSRRLVDPPFWANTRRPLDGVSTIIETEHWKITPFWVRPVKIKKYDRNRTDDSINFSGLSIEGSFNNYLTDLDLYFYRYSKKDVTINGTSGNEERYTIGAHSKGKILQRAPPKIGQNLLK